MKKIISCIITLLVSYSLCSAQQSKDSIFSESPLVLHTATGDIFGSLIIPSGKTSMPVALIIAGSGPTDRDGNNTMMKNNSLMQLANELAQAGIASLRFDKRGIAASMKAGMKESDLRFENYIDDVKSWVKLLRNDKRFNNITIIGHSEGSLIGMIAANTDADKYISIAGPGESADITLKKQLAAQPDEIKNMCYEILDSLKAGKTKSEVSPMLYTLFRPSVQPYMISWFKYNPQEEIKKLKIPILIIQGTKDLQVEVSDAELLQKANPAAKLLLVENMNHVFKIIAGEKEENIKAYSNPNLQASPVMMHAISDFILQKK